MQFKENSFTSFFSSRGVHVIVRSDVMKSLIYTASKKLSFGAGNLNLIKKTEALRTQEHEAFNNQTATLFGSLKILYFLFIENLLLH
jgi:hypothetical protein